MKPNDLQPGTGWTLARRANRMAPPSSATS